MKVIGFRPEKTDATRVDQFNNAVVELGVSTSELAREALFLGLAPAVVTIMERRRTAAIETLRTLNRLKVARRSAPIPPTSTFQK